MQGAAFALSPASHGILPGRSSRRGCGRHSSGFGAVALSQASRRGYLAPFYGGHRPGSLPAPLRHSSPSGLGSWLPNQPLVFDGRREEVKVRASSVPESAGEGSSTPTEAKSAGGGLLQTLQLGALFGLWYLFNIYFNIFNKQVLVFPCFSSYVLLYFLIFGYF